MELRATVVPVKTAGSRGNLRQPHNIMIDHRTWQFKGPELLVNLQEYDYVMDMLSLDDMLSRVVFSMGPLLSCP